MPPPTETQAPSNSSSATLIVGSVAYDHVITPVQSAERLLGGSATYGAFAASYYAATRIIGVVGNDFDTAHIDAFKQRSIDLQGLQTNTSGPTFYWKGKYHDNFVSRETLDIQLNVFESFRPELPESYRDTPYVMLGNIDPALQLHVVSQLTKPRFIIADTIDLWIETRRSELLKLLDHIDLFIINDSEAALLSQETNCIRAGHKLCTMGKKSRLVLIKKGEHGAVLFHPEGLFALPAFPVTNLHDPTGAGDAFAGAFLGYLASKDQTNFSTLKYAMAYATATASLVVEGFSCNRLLQGGKQQLEERFKELITFITFEKDLGQN